ncbi:MAG: glycosyl transferase [Clostridia bacterium]|jgi:glycosyltransferase involved in cell wall biosynthesis|nr:glycosyl transferase [Clostridia bacterium]
MDVSAIIPTYNSEKFIIKTLDSLVNQTVKFFEIIIIDDNSQDDTYPLIEDYSKKCEINIRIYKMDKNVGPSHVRNVGLSKVNTDWILFMDHDDIAEPTLLELECKRLIELQSQTDEKWVLIHSAYSEISENDEWIAGIHRWKQVRANETLGYEFVRNHIITTSGVLLDRKQALKVGGFNSKYKYSQDWDLWLKLAQKGGFGYVDEPLIRVRRHANNTSRNIKDFLKDEISILKQYDILFIQDAIYKRSLPSEKNKIDFVSVLYKMGHWEKGFDIINEVIYEKPDSPSAFFFLGLYYMNKNLWQEAQKAFEYTIKLNPKHGAALNNMGVVLALQNKINEAKIFFVRATSLFINYNDAFYNLKATDEVRKLTKNDLKITWRELRPVLLSYSGE